MHLWLIDIQDSGDVAAQLGDFRGMAGGVRVLGIDGRGKDRHGGEYPALLLAAENSGKVHLQGDACRQHGSQQAARG